MTDTKWDTPTDPDACADCGRADCLHARDSRVNCPTQWGTPIDPDVHTGECRSEDGITIGLIDGLISVYRVLAGRDLTTPGAQAALRDLTADSDMAAVHGAAGVRGEPHTTPTQPDEVQANGDPVWHVRTAHSDSRLNLDVVVITDPDNGPLVVIEHARHYVVLNDIGEMVVALRAAEVVRGERQAALEAEGGGRR